MRVEKFRFVFRLLILFGVSGLCAQSSVNHFPEIGKPMPFFEMQGIQNYSEKKVRSEDLKGKPYVLYLWSRYCSGAVQSLKNVNELHKKYKDSVTIFLISGNSRGASEKRFYFKGSEPSLKNFNELYKKLELIFGLNVPSVFDSELFQKLIPSNAVPNVILVDKNGVIKAITYKLDENKLRALLSGKSFFYHDKSFRGLQKEKEHLYTRKKPFLVDGNGGLPTAFSYRSVFAEYQPHSPKIPKIPRTIISASKDDYFGQKGVLEGWETLAELYKLAYFGYRGDTGAIYKSDYVHKGNYNQVVLELENDTLFKNINYETRNNLFVYSLIVPKKRATPIFLMKKMQSDLKSYFEFDVAIEKRSLPYWQITTSKAALEKLKTKGGNSEIVTDTYTRISFTNTSINGYLGALFYLVAPKLQLPIINEISDHSYIDIPQTDVNLFDFEAIKKVLRSQGFQIQLAEKAFNVIVISD
ncbi:redoxin domain-containing protein [Tamlana fucoidanivorans]|uniref:Redoxin domain-containing protein n=1 Tax=Allotamlana fucoidanivorans TaxID=2583814 RepID=A0A5C4SPE3_9FLAO|nr:redoxin domain-containing protein [Tamlana fucoidanivorans]TNJ46081.1 redoxin domain-containing protein [Tamlana fucoidanivorans]